MTFFHLSRQSVRYKSEFCIGKSLLGLRIGPHFHYDFGDPQHKSIFTVDTRRFSGPGHEFLDVNIAHNATGSQWLASYSMAID